MGRAASTERSCGRSCPAIAVATARAISSCTASRSAAGRVYAAYGGVYVGVAVLWLWVVDKVRPSMSDWVGVAVCLIGMAIIMFGPRSET